MSASDVPVRKPDGDGEALTAASRQVGLTLFAAVVQGAFYLRNVLLLPILTRALGAELFGAWSKAQALAGLVATFVGLGVVAGLNRLLPSADAGHRGRLVWSAVSCILATGFLAALLLAVAQPVLAPVLRKSDPASITLAVALALGIYATVVPLGQVSAAYYQLTDRPRTYGLAILLQVGSLLAAVGILARGCGSSIWVPLLAWIVGPGLAAVVFLTRISREGNVGIDRTDLHKMVRYGAPLLPLSLVLWVVDFGDRYLLTWLAGPQADAVVGQYVANYALGGLVVMAFGPFFLFYLPEVTRLWDAGKVDVAGRLTRVTVRYAVLLALPVVVVFTVYGDLVVRGMAGAGFAAEPTVIGLTMIAYGLYMVGSFAQIPLQMEKRTWAVFGIGTVAAASNLAFGILLIPRVSFWGGMRGAALATLLGFAVYLILCHWVGRRYGGPSLGYGRLLGAAAMALLAGVVLWWTKSAAPAMRFLGPPAALAVYAGGALALRLVSRQEIEIMGSAARTLAARLVNRG